MHNLKRKHKNKRDRIVGRGGAHAKTAGRGTKGQKSRAGNKPRPALRDIIKKLPKLRGYRNKSYEIKPCVVNLDVLETVFKTGEFVTREILLEKGVIKKSKGRMPKVKILGGKKDSDFKLKLSISGCQISKSAIEKIEKAGGEVK